MKFSDYKNSSKSKTEENMGNLDKNQRRFLQNFLKNYEGKNKSDVMAEIIKVAEKQRRDGNLSDGDLDNFSDMLFPMLNDAQRKELTEIILTLKTK